MKQILKGILALIFGSLALFPFLPLIAVLVIGTLAARYDVSVLFHVHLGLFLSFFVGLVTGELSIILAVVLKVLALLRLIAA